MGNSKKTHENVLQAWNVWMQTIDEIGEAGGMIPEKRSTKNE